jgi:hypothetical protein
LNGVTVIAALPLKKLWNFVSSLFDLADFKRDAIATRRKRFQLLSLEDRIVPASPLYYEYGSPENG